MKAEKLRAYCKAKHGTQRNFAESEGVKPSQVTQWLNKGFIVVDGKLYSFRRELKK